MTIHRVQVSLAGASGNPKDVYVNRYHFDSLGLVGAGPWGDLADLVWDFYNDTPTGESGALSALMSTIVAGDGHVVKIYDMSDPAPRLPVYTVGKAFTTAPDGEDALPPEVACCMSFRGALVAGSFSGPGPHLPARRYNRVYLGPWRKVVLTDGAGDAGARFSTTLRTRLEKSVDENFITAAPLVDWEWHAYSETNDASYAVEAAWIDNEPDIIRRRGRTATARTTVTF